MKWAVSNSVYYGILPEIIQDFTADGQCTWFTATVSLQIIALEMWLKFVSFFSFFSIKMKILREGVRDEVS